MRLRTAILVGVLALIAGLLTATVIAVAVVVDRSAMREVRQDLGRANQVFRDLRSDRELLYRSQARVVAEEPRLKAAVATDEPARDTVVDVAREMHETVGSDLFLLTDAEGYLIVDALAPEARGFDLSERPVVAGALESGEASGVWTDEDAAYHVTARRLVLDSKVIGVLIVGHALGERLVERLYEQTGSSVAVLLEGEVIAASEFGDSEISPKPLVAGAAEVRASNGEQVEVALDGNHYLAASGVFLDYRGERPLYYVVFADLDRVLAPGERVTRILYGIAAVAMLAGIMFAVWFSRRLTRPLEQLVDFTRVVASGRLEARAKVGGMVELEDLGDAMNRMVRELEESRKTMAEKERLENELEIAARIQTSLIPRSFDLPGLEIAARMTPAGVVGGDYFDAFALEDGGWIGIGDVAGHGLDSGLVMLMAQTSVATLVEALPEASPRGLFMALNRVVYENVNRRLEGDRHMTLSLIRYHRSGHLSMAGAHLDLLVIRAASGECEVVPTTGTWVGLVEEVGAVTVETEIELDDGDAVVLYTDGVIEAVDRDGELFGFDRLQRTVESCAGRRPAEIVESITEAVESWTAAQDDDVSVLVLRYHRESARLEPQPPHKHRDSGAGA